MLRAAAFRGAGRGECCWLAGSVLRVAGMVELVRLVHAPTSTRAPRLRQACGAYFSLGDPVRASSHVVNHPIQRLVGERIIAARRLREWTQEQLAKRVDRHQTTVGKWEDGEIEIGAISLVVLANVLGVTPNYLLGFDDSAAARALRSGTSFFVNHEAMAIVRAAKKRTDVARLINLDLEVGAEVPADWTPASEEDYRAMQAEAQEAVDRFGHVTMRWETPDSTKGRRHRGSA